MTQHIYNLITLLSVINTIKYKYQYTLPLGHSRQSKDLYFCKYMVFRLKAFYNLAQWQRPERTTPWVKSIKNNLRPPAVRDKLQGKIEI